MRVSLTAAHAHGRLTRLAGRWEDADLREETVASAGTGLGLGAELRRGLLSAGAFRLQAQGGWSAMLFDRRFPAGGTTYNGLIRVGLLADVAIGGHTRVGVGWRWAHLSNGQGVVPRNPGLDARGVWLGLASSF
ncbi:MAG: acyloxyacyl hydrolase [Burkholderiaceae bacterium]|nr:acyloxyacyl hydrolase [Burkholderiaceae bacterium]